MSSSNAFFKEPVYNRIERNYINKKILRVTWKPENHETPPQYLVTGSYTEKENTLDLWYYPTGNDENEDMFFNLPIHSLPVKKGDVTGLKFHEKDKFMYCCSEGCLGIVNLEHKKMQKLNEWNICGEAAGFDIDMSSKDVCVFGESVVFFGMDTDTKTGMIEIDNVKCLSFMRQSEIVVGNLRGQLFVYDLRNYLTPSLAFSYNSEISVGVTCVKPYPLQKHVLVSTGLDGNVTTWDLRKSTSPTDVYSGHDCPISHFQFSERRPNNMFTTCYSGEIWHWTNFENMLMNKQPIVQSLLQRKKYPTSYCDIYNEHLVAAADNDCLIIISPIKLL